MKNNRYIVTKHSPKYPWKQFDVQQVPLHILTELVYFFL